MFASCGVADCIPEEKKIDNAASSGPRTPARRSETAVKYRKPEEKKDSLEVAKTASSLLSFSKELSTSFFNIKLLSYNEPAGIGTRFTVYTIEVQNDLIQWRIGKRYSEFHHLNEALKPIVQKHKVKLPKFPGKTWTRKLSKEFLDERKKQLEKWLSEVVRYDVLAATPPVMEFLGALQDLSKLKKEHMFQKMAVNKYLKHAQTGDVILFRTIGILSSGLRAITTCDYDHVAMVVLLPSNWENAETFENAGFDRGVYLLEATADGVETHRLRTRLRQWNMSKAQIVCRSLKCKRDKWYEKEAFQFVKSTHGKNYGIRITEIVRRKSFDELDDRSAFFCSELIASFYKKVGLFPKDKAANHYYPASFAGRGPELLKGATWAEEMLLTFDIPGVGKSYQRRDKDGNLLFY